MFQGLDGLEVRLFATVSSRVKKGYVQQQGLASAFSLMSTLLVGWVVLVGAICSKISTVEGTGVTISAICDYEHCS